MRLNINIKLHKYWLILSNAFIEIMYMEKNINQSGFTRLCVFFMSG